MSEKEEGSDSRETDQ